MTLKTYDESDLQKAAWIFLANNYKDLYQICMRACNYNSDRADETMSDCVYEKMPSIIENWMLGPKLAELKHYAMSMIYWYVHKHQARERKRSKHHEFSLSDRPELDGIKDESTAKLEVKLLLAQLCERDRQIVVLTELYNYTQPEVAEILDISVGHVNARRKKALRRLKANNDA